MGLAQAAFLYRRYKLVDYLNPIANYDFILVGFLLGILEFTTKLLFPLGFIPSERASPLAGSPPTI